MKSISLTFIICSVIVLIVDAQDTFSVVAADSTTREVGSAGASCVDLFAAGFSNIGFLGDLFPDTGAINTQASYLAANQNNARKRMRAGDTPAQIISWLSANDVSFDPTTRQYGIVGFSGNSLHAAGYTGFNCLEYKNHITGKIDGIHYSIQGNILLGQEVLDSMEANFRSAQGDLACRLMSALQGAKIVGADTRCAPNGSSTLFAFVKVSQPTDKYGSPSFSVGVRTRANARIEPIDTLQKLFNLQHSCTTSASQEFTVTNLFNVYPNPSNGKIIVVINNDRKSFQNGEIRFFNVLGKAILNSNLNLSRTEIDISSAGKGIYFYQLLNGNSILKSGKIIVGGNL